MLERYRLGELDSEDQKAVNEALAADGELRSQLAKLEESDRELRLRYPAGHFGLDSRASRRGLKLPGKRVMRFARIAAVVLVCIMLPVVYFLRSGTGVYSGVSVAAGSPVDRAKGSVPAGAELSLYLKDDPEIPLSDQTVLREGSTVQLAYTTPAGAEYYGVIFSIDGRSEVTMHYPYRRGMSSLLVSGRRTFLNEAYTLDDAPDYELFVMVISALPLDADTVIREAQRIAGTSVGRSQLIETFEGCEVEIVSVLKR